MAKLRKTLPKEFHDVAASGDTEQIKALLRKCEPNACLNRYGGHTALMNPHLPNEVIRWLVEEYGADVNYADTYGRTALSEAAVHCPERLALLVSLGADVNFQIGTHPTALLYAAGSHCVEGVRELVRLGADVGMTGGCSHCNALMEALLRCQNIDIPATAAIARILLDSGLAVTDEMKQQVTKIGEAFAFYRDSFATDLLEETDAALQAMYDIFDVPPVPPWQKYDGSEPIQVQADTWQAQFDELWQQLVPGSGKAAFVQGEVIRIAGRLGHEILDNGGINWDGDFRTMRDTLAGWMAGGKAAEERVLHQIHTLSPSADEAAMAAVTQAAVQWVLDNPDPLPLKTVDYRR